MDAFRKFVRYRPPRPGEDPAANRMRERIGGTLLATLGIGFTIAGWSNHFPPRAAFEFPAVAVIGLALLLIPGYRTERRERGEDVEALHGRALITRRWWLVALAAIIAGAANAGLMSLSSHGG